MTGVTEIDNEQTLASCSPVTVIIPAYNSSESLERSITSALSQTLPPSQVIVINDGSTDETRDVALKFSHDIVYFEQENHGQGHARNVGLEKATGGFIVFLDSDDFLLPEFLTTCLRFLKSNNNTVAVSTGFKILRKHKEYVGPANIDKLSKENPDGLILDNFFDFWAKYDHVRTGTTVIRKDVIDKAGYQRADLRISQDLEYWGYIATFGSWGFIPKVLWVGDSYSYARKTGWLEKYNKRRAMCPNIESWEKRIVPRLKENELHGFKLVRGRVASYFAHNKILSGNNKGALEIIHKFSQDMPNNRLVKFMKFGAQFNAFIWATVCQIIKMREMLKG